MPKNPEKSLKTSPDTFFFLRFVRGGRYLVIVLGGKSDKAARFCLISQRTLQMNALHLSLQHNTVGC